MDAMARLPSVRRGRTNGTPLIVVEDCEILKVTSTSTCVALGFQFDTVPTRGTDDCAYSAPSVVAEPLNSLGQVICLLRLQILSQP